MNYCFRYIERGHLSQLRECPWGFASDCHTLKLHSIREHACRGQYAQWEHSGIRAALASLESPPPGESAVESCCEPGRDGSEARSDSTPPDSALE